MSSSTGLFRPDSFEPFYTEERCYITELMNTTRSDDVSVAQCRVEPGVTTQLHKLSVAERYVVSAGSGIMELDARETFAIGPGDCVLIPPECPQRVRNTGTQALVFLCICTPRFLPQQYTNLEAQDTPPIEELT